MLKSFNVSGFQKTLINKRNDSFEFLFVELICEFLFVAVVDRIRTRDEVAAREPEEAQASPRPSEDSETKPLGNLAQIVGASYILVHTFLR